MPLRLALLLVVVTSCAPATLGARLGASLAPLKASVPGGVVGVERGGQVVFLEAFGLADVELGTPMTRQSVFCIGSISKQFGAAAVLQLVEAGSLRLDEPIARFFPDFPRADRITVRHLLHHTSGIVDFEYEGAWPDTMAVERTQDEVIATFRDLPPLFEPGTRWSYSTSNYVLLGRIIEKVTGLSLAEVLKTRVFAPAGLTHTRFCDAHELIPGRAHGYDAAPKGFVPAKPSLYTQFGVGGGLCSTVDDLLAWQRALEGGRVVKAESWRLMHAAAPLSDGTPTGYGFGLFEGAVDGHPVITHTGGVSGFATKLTRFVHDDLTVVVLTNTRDAPLDELERALTQPLLELRTPPEQPRSAEALARYVTTVTMAPMRLRFAVVDQRLHVFLATVRAPEEDLGALRYVGSDTFLASDTLRVTFRFDQGRVKVVLLDAGGAVLPAFPE